MKAFTLLFFLIGFQQTSAGYVKCSNSPKKHGYKKGKYGVTANFEKKGLAEWKIVKDVKKRVDRCSIYSSIKSDVNKWYKKARDYKDWSQTKGITKRGIRRKGANCLAEVNSALLKLGKKASGFESQQVSGMGTSSHDYGGNTRFNWKDYCDRQSSTSISTNSGGSKSGGSKSGGSRDAERSCPASTKLVAKKVPGYREQVLTGILTRIVRNKCMYKINGKGMFFLYAK